MMHLVVVSNILSLHAEMIQFDEHIFEMGAPTATSPLHFSDDNIHTLSHYKDPYILHQPVDIAGISAWLNVQELYRLNGCQIIGLKNAPKTVSG